jgi:hypothetical protein
VSEFVEFLRAILRSEAEIQSFDPIDPNEATPDPEYRYDWWQQ